MATPSALRNLLYCAKAYAFRLKLKALKLAAIAFAESPEGIALAKKTKAAAAKPTRKR